MEFRFYLDNNLVDEPIVSGGLSSSIIRARDIGGLVQKQESTVTFINSGYDYILSIYDSVGWSGVMSCYIEKSVDGLTWKPHYTGKVFIRDIEFDKKRRYAKTPIVDNTFYALINNNKSIKVRPAGTLSKNGATITELLAQSSQWYDQITGATVLDDAGNRSYCPWFSVNDYLTRIIAYITDGNILFESSVFGNGGEFEHLKITNGHAFRSSMSSGYNVNATTYNTDYTNDIYTRFYDLFEGVSLEDMLNNLGKITRLSFIIDTSTSTPTFRLENETYFENTEKVLICENVAELKEKVETSLLYSKVKFGSAKVIDYDAGWAPIIESYPFIVWNQEEFPLSYEANLDNELDLQLTFITSSNVIQDILVNRFTAGDDEYDKDIILWDFEDGSRDSVKGIYNWLTGTSVGTFPGFYNYSLTNQRITQRFFGGIPSALATSLPQVLDERFLAYMNAGMSQTYSGSSTIQPIEFNEDAILPGYDTNGNYNIATFTYTAASTGLYTFLGNLKCRAIATFVAISQNYWYDTKFSLYLYINGTSSNDRIITYTIVPVIGYNSTISFVVYGSGSVYLNAADTVQFKLGVTSTAPGNDLTYIIDSSSYISCTSSPTFQYNYATYEPKDYAPVRVEFDYPVSDDQWTKIESKPRGQIEATLGNETYLGNIESFRINHKTNMAKIILNTKKQINGA